MVFSLARQLYISELTVLYDEAEAAELFFIALEHVCYISKNAYVLKRNIHLTANEESGLLSLLNELKTGKPIQYLLGQTEFYGLTFKVNGSVLIPRPETEELVDWVHKESITYKEQKVDLDKSKVSRILDIGTGSGCIPVSLKKNLPDTDVYGIDVSDAALSVARENAKLNGVEIEFKQLDILNPLSGFNLPAFDIIVSNPPYVKVSEKAAMHVNVLQYEPHLALFVPDENPLIFYIKIADFSIQHLVPGGLLFFEINETEAASLIKILTDKQFKDIELKKDINGKDRMLKASRQ